MMPPWAAAAKYTAISACIENLHAPQRNRAAAMHKIAGPMSSAAEVIPPVDVVSVPEPVPPAGPAVPLFDRELGALSFNERVLAEAKNPSVPLLERVKFLRICAHNLHA